MKQNDMPTLEELKAMSQVDITSVERSTLVDIESIQINQELSIRRANGRLYKANQKSVLLSVQGNDHKSELYRGKDY